MALAVAALLPSPISFPQNMLAPYTLAVDNGVRSLFIAPGMTTQSYPFVVAPIYVKSILERRLLQSLFGFYDLPIVYIINKD